MDNQMLQRLPENVNTYKELVELLRSTIKKQKIENKQQSQQIDLQQKLIKEQNRLILSLESRIKELERQLKLDSHTSSKPPTSDGFKHKPRRSQSLRTKSTKKSGGQKGHTGNTLKQVANPEKVFVHEPEKCTHCEADLKNAPIQSVSKRQSFDVPPLKLIATEHQAATKHCTKCNKLSTGNFPVHITAPVQYGKRLMAMAIYLQHFQFLPEDRLCDFFSQVFGVPISAAQQSLLSEPNFQK